MCFIVHAGSGDIFGGEFGGYDLKDGEFGRDMEDIELLRPMAEVTRLGANKIDDSLKNGGGGSSIDVSVCCCCCCVVSY